MNHKADKHSRSTEMEASDPIISDSAVMSAHI